MSEKILKALMQLFAIIARPESNESDRRVVVDYQLVDLRKPVLVALAEPLVFHAPAPMRVARGEAAVSGDLVHLVVAQDFEDRREDVQPGAPRELFDSLLLIAEVVRKGGFQGELGHALLALPEELSNRLDDRVTVVDLARDQLVVFGEVLLEVFDELPRAVGAIDLAVAKDVRGREKKLLEDVDTQ